jgi:hypothetical protein
MFPEPGPQGILHRRWEECNGRLGLVRSGLETLHCVKEQSPGALPSPEPAHGPNQFSVTADDKRLTRIENETRARSDLAGGEPRLVRVCLT